MGVDHTASYVTGDLSNNRQVIYTVMSTSANTRGKESVSCGWDLKLPEEWLEGQTKNRNKGNDQASGEPHVKRVGRTRDLDQ